MKRILISAMLMGSAALTASYGATGAFFSDAETSAGNVFTAGSVDLTIDHSLSTYNNQQVENTLTIVSDPNTTFSGDNGSGNAVNLTFIHSAWTASIPDAHWIWATDPVSDPTVVQTNTFTRTFNWSGPVTAAYLEFAADNYYHIELNGFVVGDNQSLITDNFQQNHHTDVTSHIVQGVNTLTITVTNEHVDGSTPQSNPAGLLFKLQVEGQALNPEPIDLSGEPFWSFDDVKPADQGRDVFSLHVDSNDAWACMIVSNIQNDENDRIEPETSAGDSSDGPGNGELGQFLHLFLWKDTNANGVFEPGLGELALMPLVGESFAGTELKIPVNDSTIAGGVLPGGTSENVGSAWCAGDMAVDGTSGVITCDGNAPNINQSQTDSTTADLTFYATQSRNQPDFTCADVSLDN